MGKVILDIIHKYISIIQVEILFILITQLYLCLIIASVLIKELNLLQLPLIKYEQTLHKKN